MITVKNKIKLAKKKKKERKELNATNLLSLQLHILSNETWLEKFLHFDSNPSKFKSKISKK